MKFILFVSDIWRERERDSVYLILSLLCWSFLFIYLES